MFLHASWFQRQEYFDTWEACGWACGPTIGSFMATLAFSISCLLTNLMAPYVFTPRSAQGHKSFKVAQSYQDPESAVQQYHGLTVFQASSAVLS
jgi:hypothetical protein